MTDQTPSVSSAAFFSRPPNKRPVPSASSSPSTNSIPTNPAVQQPPSKKLKTKSKVKPPKPLTPTQQNLLRLPLPFLQTLFGVLADEKDTKTMSRMSRTCKGAREVGLGFLWREVTFGRRVGWDWVLGGKGMRAEKLGIIR